MQNLCILIFFCNFARFCAKQLKRHIPMTKKLTTVTLALFVCFVSVFAAGNSRSITSSLQELKNELHASYLLLPEDQAYFDAEYARRHQELQEAIIKANEQSILLYTQHQYMTFDMSYALQKVTSEYKEFNKNQSTYDWIVKYLNFEINRYARLIESLRRLPPQKTDIEVDILPDSLLYHNDSLDWFLSRSSSAIEEEIICLAQDTAHAPFVLDRECEQYRDSCIFYASEVLKLYAENRAIILQDTAHYRETYLRLKENYDYAEARYQELQNYVFHDGQIPFITLLKNFSLFRTQVQLDLSNQYDTDILRTDEETNLDEMSTRTMRFVQVIGCIVQLVALALFWLVCFFILWIVSRFVKTNYLKKKKNLVLFSLLIGTLIYVLAFRYAWTGYEYLHMGVKNINTFLWLLIAITGSLLVRVKPNQIKQSIWLYSPAFFIAFVIIFCRNTFIPDSLMVLIFPPIMLLVIIRQLLFCISKRNQSTSIDRKLGWISLIIYIAAFVFAFLGYTFVCLLVLIWWYFQLALLLAILSLSDLLDRFKEKWLSKRINAMRERITYVSGEDRESLLFGATWFYDLVRQVSIPAMLVLSVPMCAHMSLNIFDFDDLFMQYYTSPFISIVGDDGVQNLCISAQSLVYLIILFFIMRYFSRAIHAGWQYSRYAMFMRKYKRTNIRPNEINLSLGNSIISVLIWMVFIIIVVVQWKIPTGSLGLIAGGLSAGIGLAMKDIINNFIYGIQLMGGRLRVGDWIECDGVRGKVTSINYQCVQVETIDYTEMSFLNSSLFGKNFNNLTRNHSYEMTKLTVGVAYGTDVEKAREVLVEAMQTMRTKDRYGREIVDPQRGIYVIVDEMADSAVVLGVKQMVLVAERIPYVERGKEVMYKALMDAGITIAFPQLDVHMIKDEQ